MSMTVKAYLEGGEEQNEIRRFAVDTGVSTSFTYLTNKIPQVFPSLAGKTFDVFWKDSENDCIAFSSDDELTEALGYVNDGIFKIYIKPTTRGSNPRASNEGVLHQGVVCDGCESGIHGNRFKCCVCPDYDLCAVCEQSGLHGEHPMIRVSAPEQWHQMPGQPFGCMPPHGPPPHHPPPSYGGPGCPPFGGPGGPPPFGGPGGPPPPFGAPGFAFGGGPGGHCKPWRKMMKRCWRKWWRDMYQNKDGDCGADSDTDKEAMKEPKEPKKEKESTQKGASAHHDDGDSPTEEYLKDVGESVAAMLDPLGIDVAVDVECHGKRKKCHNGTGRGRGWGRGRGFGRGWGSFFFGPGMGRGGMFGYSSGRDASTEGAGTPCGQSASPCHAEGQSSDVNMDENVTSEEHQQPAGNRSPSASDVQMGSPQNADNDGDWMLLSQDKETKEEPAEETAPSHPIPRMAQALEQLRAMGFNDEGGWLTQLIEAKNGDLNKVLDALKPHQPIQPQ